MTTTHTREPIETGPSLPRALFGGFVGTVLMTLLLYYLAPLLTGQPMDVAAMLATAAGGSWMFGMILHFVDGTVIFPAVYARGVYPLLGGSPTLRGTTMGLILWFLSQAIVMPAMGAGFFSSQAGGFAAVLMMLVAHIAYGVCLGALAGTREEINLGVELAERTGGGEPEGLHGEAH